MRNILNRTKARDYPCFHHDCYGLFFVLFQKLVSFTVSVLAKNVFRSATYAGLIGFTELEYKCFTAFRASKYLFNVRIISLIFRIDIRKRHPLVL